MARKKNLQAANLPVERPARRRKKNVKRAKAKEIELHPDAWERFEKGLKQIAKATRKPSAEG